jgi:hypothetical protein
MKRLFSLLIIFLAGCTALNERAPHLTEAEANTVVALARDKVLVSGLVNDAKEIEIIRNGKPNLSYYFLARPYADYFVYWQINNKESVGVYGRGNILVLENAEVTRGNNRSVKPGT